MKVLIVGLGSIGKKHIDAIKCIQPDVEIIALRSKIDSENYLDVRNIYNLDESELLSVDFVIISNPTSEHRKTLEIMAEFNLPLFIEKPLSADLDIEKLIFEIESKHIRTYVACNLRFLDCIQFVKNKLLSSCDKRLNEVNIYCGSYLPEWRTNVDFRKTYSAISELGGGVHIDLIHELDYIYWMFGSPNNVQRSFRSQSSLNITAFDYANYLLDYSGFCVSVVLNYFRRDSKRSLELVFEDETWNVDLLTNTITCNNQVIFSSDQRIKNTYETQMTYFISCVLKNENTFNTIINAYDVLKICLAQ